MNAIRTKHNLDFYSGLWRPSWFARFIIFLVRPKDDDDSPLIKWQIFRVGTCEGQWRVTAQAFEVLSIVNNKKGNGHLDDVLEWFEWSARISKMPLRILRFTNERFKKHLIEKRGYHLFGKEDVEKTWN